MSDVDFATEHAEAKRLYLAGDGAWVPTTEAVWWYFLGVLPPLFCNGSRFACGEPWRHDARGRAVYLWLDRRPDGSFAMRYAAPVHAAPGYFPEEQPYLQRCRFGDACRHDPRCPEESGSLLHRPHQTLHK